MKWKLLSCVRFFATPWRVVCQAPLSMEFSSQDVHYLLEWVAYLFSRGPSQPRDRIQVSRTAGGFFTIWATREAIWQSKKKKKKKNIYIYICIHTSIHTHIFAVFQWLRTCLPVQRTQFQALVGEGPTCRGAPKPVHLTEALGPRAAAPQQEKPPQWEAHAPRLEAAPAHHSWRRPVSSNEDRAELK